MRKTEKDSRNKASAPVDETPLLRFLRQLPPEKLDRAVRLLKKTVPPANLRKAMEELIARAPFEQFPTLKDVYMRHVAP